MKKLIYIALLFILGLTACNVKQELQNTQDVELSLSEVKVDVPTTAGTETLADKNSISLALNELNSGIRNEVSENLNLPNTEAVTDSYMVNNFHNMFEGTIGSTEIKMNIYRDLDKLTASYIVADDDSEINLEGTLIGNKLDLNSVDKNDGITFSGIINESNIYKGTFQSLQDNSRTTFELRLIYGSYGTKEHYYGNLNSDTNTVNNFAGSIKSYITNENKTELAKLINYPIEVYVKDERTTIENADEFILHYDDIITPSFKNAISNCSTKFMFNNYQGVMLGNGEIWFTEIYEKDGLWIRAINNY